MRRSLFLLLILLHNLLKPRFILLLGLLLLGFNFILVALDGALLFKGFYFGFGDFPEGFGVFGVRDFGAAESVGLELGCCT